MLLRKPHTKTTLIFNALRRQYMPSSIICVALPTKEEPPPPVPPPPEDLSTWAVPELVQLPPVPPPVVAMVESPPAKPTAAEKVYPYAPGTTFAVQVPTQTPLELVLEKGEQVRNIVGGIGPLPKPSRR